MDAQTALKGRVLHDVFAYAHRAIDGSEGFLIEYDARPSEVPPLLPTLKKYVLRRKVRIRDVSQEWDVWAAWGSEVDGAWETQRRWLHASSGAIEPVWDGQDEAPWGTEPGVLQDRRAIGMGHRMLVRKGDRRE